MAKLGEGDERWIVDDMGSQGTNVRHQSQLHCILLLQIIRRSRHSVVRQRVMTDTLQEFLPLIIL